MFWYQVIHLKFSANCSCYCYCSPDLRRWLFSDHCHGTFMILFLSVLSPLLKCECLESRIYVFWTHRACLPNEWLPRLIKKICVLHSFVLSHCWKCTVNGIDKLIFLKYCISSSIHCYKIKSNGSPLNCI